MQQTVLYIPYTTSSHEKTGKIITFAQFEEENLVENQRNAEEDESILSSIYESSTDDDSDDRSISTNALENLQDGSQIHPKINARDDRLKICDHIRQTKHKWKGA